MGLKNKSKKVFKKRSCKDRIKNKKNKKRNTRKRTNKFTNKNIRGGALTRNQLQKLSALGYTIKIDDNQRIIIEGVPDKLLMNTALKRDAIKDARFIEFKNYIQELLDNDIDIPDNLTDMASTYISGCDLEINNKAKNIMTNLLTNPQANKAEIGTFRAYTKKIGSLLNTSDGLKELSTVQEVIFNELPEFGANKKRKKSQLQRSTLYKYIIHREPDGRHKIYYSCAHGLYHFSYIDYFVKQHYNEDETPRVNDQGERMPTQHLFFVKKTSIPEQIIFLMSWGNAQVIPEWFSLLKNFASQNEVNVEFFVRENVNSKNYPNVLNAFHGNLAEIIAEMKKIESTENIDAYIDYVDKWNTIIMGGEISHSCLTYALEVTAAGEFCTDVDGNIYYVDGWSGHFKTPQEYIHVIEQVFRQYGYTNLQNFNNRLAEKVTDIKCRDEAAENCNNQLKQSETF